MTTCQNHHHQSRSIEDVYDPEDVGLRDSPLLKQMNVNLRPSPSPEPLIPLPPVSLESSPDPEVRKGSTRHKHRPSPGDAVLISFLANGKHVDVARDAGEQPLPSDNEAEEEPRGTNVTFATAQGVVAEIDIEQVESMMDKETEKESSMDLAAIAAGAVGVLREKERASSDTARRTPTPKVEMPTEMSFAPEDRMEDVKPSIPVVNKGLHVNVALASFGGNLVKHEIVASPTNEELPPMLEQSPKSGQSNGSGSHQITLPSIHDTIGDITRIPQPVAIDNAGFVQSPPGRPIPRFPAPGLSHGSPPKSPHDTFRRELPSPGRGSFFYNNVHRRPSQADGPQYSSPADYSGNNTETPSTDQSASTPANIAIDRMSIDGITNPQVGGFQCVFAGCNAPPFQTQYLLNSHANVHSSNRPHYCSVKGCPRAEGGKGFKRKNEMIRHGLVHDSPGYVCPFCPDREHKYPRPDNLQRHVRVHHQEKDKDDPLLRDVLSQRPEGPSKGRRRRGGTS